MRELGFRFALRSKHINPGVALQRRSLVWGMMVCKGLSTEVGVGIVFLEGFETR